MNESYKMIGSSPEIPTRIWNSCGLGAQCSNCGNPRSSWQARQLLQAKRTWTQRSFQVTVVTCFLIIGQRNRRRSQARSTEPCPRSSTRSPDGSQSRQRMWINGCRKHPVKDLDGSFGNGAPGSGRLSLMLMAASMAVGFPVDYRYGWDLAHPPHQVLLRKCHSEFCPAHLFAAPTCTPWSVSSSSKPPDVRDRERQAELPTLEFLYEVLLHQHNQNLGFTVEQPYGSGMLVDSPVSRLRDLGGTRAWRLDQCMLGAQCEQGHPIKKPTALFSNRRWKMVVKRCDNHRGTPHGVLQGQVRGINRTAMAAVYPKRLCLLYGQDLWSILRKDNRMSCKPWPQQLLWVHGLYYSCERCQLGRAAPPGCEHTMIAGQCRYGQPGMRRARATAQHAPPVEPPALPAPTTTPSEPQAPQAPTTTPAESTEPPAPPLSPKALAVVSDPYRSG